MDNTSETGWWRCDCGQLVSEADLRAASSRACPACFRPDLHPATEREANLAAIGVRRIRRIHSTHNKE